MQKLSICFVLSALAILTGFSSAQTASAPSASSPSQTDSSGLTLPKTGMVFIDQGSESGQELTQLHATEIVSNSHAAANFARGTVYMGPHASIEIKGLNASAHVAAPRPHLYVRINSEDPELMRRRIHLIRLEQTKDRRVVSNYSQNIFGGQRAKKYDDVPVTKADVEPDVWLKVTPETALTPGEYAIVFMSKDAWLTPDAVYDFGVGNDAAKTVSK